MIKHLKKLTHDEIKVLKGKFESVVFPNDFDLVYEAQVPNTGIVLLNGDVALYKRKKLKSLIMPGSMLGVYELLNNCPTQLNCKVLRNSELILIRKSDLLDALSDKTSELYDIIKGNILI